MNNVLRHTNFNNVRKAANTLRVYSSLPLNKIHGPKHIEEVFS